MKIDISHQPPGGVQEDGMLTDLSAEAAVRREIVKLGQWLVAHGIDLDTEPGALHVGSRDRLYLRLGLFSGLKQALALLTNRGQSVH